MAAESPIRMLDNDPSFHASPFNNIVLHEGFTEVLKDSCVLEEPARVVPDRSGSAPPTIEGSISAFRTFMYHRHSTMGNNEFSDCESEEQIRTNPGYISYYYANVNLNPRLPPPLLSRENRHLVRLMGYLGSKKSTSVNDGLLATHREEEPEEDISLVQSMGDQIGQIVSEKVSSLTVDNRGLIDLKKEGVIQTPSPTSGRAIKEENGHDIHTVSTNQVSETQESCSGANEVRDIQQTVKATSACHRSTDIDDNMSTQSNMGSDYSAVESRMKSLNVSGTSGVDDKQKRHDNVQLHDMSRISSHPLQNMPIPFPGIHVHALPKLPGMQPLMPNSGLAPPLYAATAAYMNSGNHYYPSLPPTSFPHPQFSVSGFIGNPVFHAPNPGGYLQGNAFPMSIDAYSTPWSVKQPIEVTRGIHPYPGHMMLRPSCNEPLPGQFQHQPFGNVWRSATPHGQLTRRDGVDGQFDIHAAQKCTDRAYSISVPPNAGPLRVNFYGPRSLNLPNFSVPSPALVLGSPMARTYHSVPENDMEIPQHSPKNAVPNYWEKGQRSGNSDDSKRHSFLELLKSSSSRKLELADISGQIAELSTDQHGSRFIQQKLEHCGVDEKETVFGEILPHASKLMIDVFGNYVIQKFFEHGTTEHRRKLGQQLSGQIVTLSLQMYGCRVIQKALEVIEIDQKVELVKELNGHVMKCVHDQNGNHVIQKCIESIPAERIGFIISSFYGQVASLSSHPYGCRVIQRILEHCSDEKLSQCIVDEILEAACTLAQDPYGNYVTQHILEKGKPQERSQIICKLTGKFVQMSQHKYASNVVEKCLKYGGASEQNLIIEEIFAQPNNNDALLMMMKDQFANYVIQRIFDVGNDKQRNILLNCIRTHLPVLKRFPYAKHLVARYEQVSEGSTKEQK